VHITLYTQGCVFHFQHIFNGHRVCAYCSQVYFMFCGCCIVQFLFFHIVTLMTGPTLYTQTGKEIQLFINWVYLFVVFYLQYLQDSTEYGIYGIHQLNYYVQQYYQCCIS